MLMRIAPIGLLGLPIAAWCQIPVISSMVNAASYEVTAGYPGYIVTLFGTNLAGTTASAPSFPLPLSLGGTSVTVNGVTAPLFYVSPTQINLQIPDAPTISPIVVSTSGASSAPYDPNTATPNAWQTGGIFTIDSSGCGRGAVLNVALDGSLSVNSPANSASPGDWISVFGTGILSGLNSDAPINMPAPPSVGGTNNYGANQLEFDFSDYSPVPPWAGLAPGFIGVDQINAQIPTTVREGCAVPLQVPPTPGETGITQPVTIAIHQGGGQCIDPPSPGYGQIIWQKNVDTTALNAVSESDTLTVSLQASPGKQAPSAPTYSEQCNGPQHTCNEALLNSYTLFGAACPIPGYRELDAGTVTMQGPGIAPTSVQIAPYQESVEVAPQMFQQNQVQVTAYQANLPNGGVQAGTYTVNANGGTDVGAFQAALQVGQDIQIQTPLAGIDVFANCATLVINWTGGDPNSWVTFKLIQHESGFDGVLWSAQTRTSNGTLTFPAPTLEGFDCQGSSGFPATISIEVDPDPSEVTTFSAPGLSLGGQATWRYLHTFEAKFD
jgi:uncharacterized protein (TIGR03437 family)